MRTKVLGIFLVAAMGLVFMGCPIIEPPRLMNADLSSLTVSEGTLTPAFIASKTSYTVSVANSISSISVFGTRSEEGPLLAQSQELNVGSNLIIMTVIALDKRSTKNYVITVTRAP